VIVGKTSAAYRPRFGTPGASSDIADVAHRSAHLRNPGLGATDLLSIQASALCGSGIFRQRFWHDAGLFFERCFGNTRPVR
jgi:hypothetical protein